MDWKANADVEARFTVERGAELDWRVAGATLRERLNEPYQLVIDLLRTPVPIDARAMLGTACELAVTRHDVQQHVAGIVTSIRDGVRREGVSSVATVTVEPALAALRHRRDTRIFQDLTVPQILEQVLGADLEPYGRTVRLSLVRTYPAREYTVQYQESDFDFVHRLMEEEGITYFFAQSGGPEVMTLVDRTAAHPRIDTEGALLRYTDGWQADHGPDSVPEFQPIAQLTGSRVVTRTFDWTHPSMEIAAEVETRGGPELESYVVDAPITFYSFASAYGAHNTPDQALLHRERQARDGTLARGVSIALALQSGQRFELQGHWQPELDREWTVVEVEHRFLDHVQGFGQTPEGTLYVNRFSCLPSDVPWRPAHVRDRRRIHGVQTATVVGPAGEEIYTDEHQRIKVQFHWDRLGRRDENSSCWIRVMQPWAGPGWGHSVIPRIGMEVVVTFIEGDPDRPLVTGVVYNGEAPPPYQLPDNKTRSTMKSRTSPGGNGYNEFRFEDKAGQEEIWLHGQKDWNTVIEHDHTRRVGHDESQVVVNNRSRNVGVNEQIAIGNDQSRTVGNDKSESVGNNRSRSVGVDESLSIGNDRSIQIGANLTETVGQNLMQSVAMNAMLNVGLTRTTNIGVNEVLNVIANAQTKVGVNADLQIGKDWNIKIGDDLNLKIKGSEKHTTKKNRTRSVLLTETITVGVMQTINVTGVQMVNVGPMQTTNIGGKQSINVKGDQGITVGGSQKTEVTANAETKAKVVLVDAGEKLHLKCGGAEILLEGGNVTIKATGTITVDGAAGVNLNSPANVKVDGAKILLNC